MSLSQETIGQLRQLAKDATTNGITTGTGLVYYNLEPFAKTLQPKPTPFRNKLSRAKSMTAGSGVVVNWKAITATDGGIVGGGIGQYPGVAESARNSVMSITEKNYSATFAALGKEVNTTFEAESASQGFDSARGIATKAKLNALMISEERMIIGGNAGSGAGLNGFAAGTAATPVCTLVTGTGLTTARYVSAAVCYLTYWGLQFASVSGGVVTTSTRTAADGSTDVINGGSSAVSAMSNIVQTTGSTLQVKATVAPLAGVLGYAWYFDVETSSTQALGTALLAAITTVPTYTLKANPTGSQTAAAAGLNADHSASALDFSGLCSVTAAAGTVTDLGGAQLTSVGDGTIAEFETLLFNLANSYFLTPTDAYMNAAIFSQVCSAIITTGNASTNVSRINIEANSLGQITGGTFPVAYRSKFAGAAMGESTPGVINLRYHPLMADGCILFDMADNPYPDAEIPAVRRIMTMREYYSIPWPLRTRKYEEGVYVNETLQHYIPFSTVMLTGIGHA